MKLRVIFLVLALFSGLSSFGAASTFSEAADRLNGEWRGDDFVLRVDAKRAQASVDASHPFAWEHFVIKEVTPAEVVFTIGPELYEARIEADILTLTGTSFRGARVLFREGGDLRGTTSE
jgi:hypothetical protein